MLQSNQISIYDIPCYARNENFLDALISDIGIVAQKNHSEAYVDKFNVMKIMIFTNHQGTINRRVKGCVDGENFMILVAEESSVSLEKDSLSSSGLERASNSSEDEGDEGASDSLSIVDSKAEEAVDGDQSEGEEETTKLLQQYNEVTVALPDEAARICSKLGDKPKDHIMEKEGFESEQRPKSSDTEGYFSETISRVAGTVEENSEKEGEACRVRNEKVKVEAEGFVSNRVRNEGPLVNIWHSLSNKNRPGVHYFYVRKARNKSDPFKNGTCKKVERWSDLSEEQVGSIQHSNDTLGNNFVIPQVHSQAKNLEIEGLIFYDEC